jgi:molybdate transport system ATP-binding protein
MSPKHMLLSFELLRESKPTGLGLITGANGAGKSRAARELALATHGAHLLSAESQQAFYEQELQRDESNFRQGTDTSTKVRDLLGDDARSHELAAAFRLEALWDRGFRLLSTGEARKVMLMQAVLRDPALLVLDEPFDGLDAAACEDLTRAIGQVATRMPVIVVGSFAAPAAGESFALPVSALREVIVLEAGAAVFQGSAQAWIARAGASTSAHRAAPVHLGNVFQPPCADVPLVELKRGRVQYGDSVVFADLDFTVYQGQHTLIQGPNGSGKSTLLELITGDHPQAYSNDLHLFGRRRGSGESVWEIKRKVGVVSSRLHRDYHVGGSVEDVLVSGLYDSIGVYTAPAPTDRARARAWLDWLMLDLEPGAAFRELSFGTQRLVLVARAAIKVPPLVVLDEPTTGLDPENRMRVLALVESLCLQKTSTELFVTHRDDERAFWDARIRGARLLLGPQRASAGE